MAQNVARLGVVMGLDTTEFEQALGSAKNKVTELANKIPEMALAGAIALGAMATKALQFSDQISDLSDATGISISKILQLSDALEMSGGHFDDAGKTIEKFAQNIDTAAQGSKPLQDAFSRIGVSLQDLKNLNTEELLKKTAEGIANMGDKASQTGEKVALFGRSMKGVDMVAFNEEIQKSSSEYDRYQAAIALTADMHDKLEKKTMMLTLAFTEHLMPTIVAMLDTWVQKGGMAEMAFDKIHKLLLGLWYAAGSVSNAFEVMGAAWDKIFSKMTDEQYQEKLRKIYADQIMFQGKLQALITTPEYKQKNQDSGGRDVTAAKDTEADKQKNMLYTATLISEEYRRQQVFSLQQLATRNQMIGMTDDERKIQEAVNQVLDSTSKKVDEITKAREAAAGRGANEIVLKEYDDQIAKVEELGKLFADMAKEQEKYSLSVQRTFEYGWNKAFKQYAEDAYNYGKMGENSFKSITANMTNAINTFVETGKFSFSNFARSVIMDLIKIQTQALATKAVTAAFNAVSGSSIVTTALSFLGFADGGRPPTDKPSIVGENGPELFVPDRAGTVIPNSQLSGGGSQSSPQIVYNGPYIANMSAIDTQSGIQFLAKNKSAIWAANLSASRSLPSTR